MSQIFVTNRRVLANARELRCSATDAEAKLWACLRGRCLGGFKFRRQHPVEKLILDFYCSERRLGIELDGGGHVEVGTVTYDEARTRSLDRAGVRVIRFWNDDVMLRLPDVLEEILRVLSE